jgi:hypothetical protein
MYKVETPVRGVPKEETSNKGKKARNGLIKKVDGTKKEIADYFVTFEGHGEKLYGPYSHEEIKIMIDDHQTYDQKHAPYSPSPDRASTRKNAKTHEPSSRGLDVKKGRAVDEKVCFL